MTDAERTMWDQCDEEMPSNKLCFNFIFRNFPISRKTLKILVRFIQTDSIKWPKSYKTKPIFQHTISAQKCASSV